MNYNTLNNLNNNDKATLNSLFQGILLNLKHISVTKIMTYIRYIPDQCRMHYNSLENRKIRNSHKKGNIYSEKVNVLPIEGDGNNINPNYQISLTSHDLTEGVLDKNPSRIIVTDITTIDKARLGRKIGRVSSDSLAIVDKLLKKHLEL